MKIVKIASVVVAAVVVLIVAVVLVVLSRIDSLAKSGIERGGTYALGVPTTLDRADVGLASGKFSLAGLKVANPQGFKSDRIFGLGTGSVSVSYGTLRGDVITLPELKLDTLRVNLEKADGKTNYKVILDNLKKVTGEGKPAEKPKGAEKKFVISEVEISNVVVHVDLVGIGGGLTQADLPLERVSLKNVGTANKGATASEMASILVRAVLEAAAEQGGGIIPDDMLGDLRGQLASLGNLADLGVVVDSEVGKAAGEIIEGAGKAAEQAIEDTAEQLKGLIPGKKKDGGK